MIWFFDEVLLIDGLGKAILGLSFIFEVDFSDGSKRDLFKNILLEVDGFSMGFEAYCVELELNPQGIVLPLLREVRGLGELEEAPEGNSNCRNCQLLEGLVGSVGENKK